MIVLVYDEFGFAEEAPPQPESPAPAAPQAPMREHFPPAGSGYLGGASDGWEYRTVFGGARLTATYDMVKQFLREEGYGDVPLPATAEELRLFRRAPAGAQLHLFVERGYAHNPIKILFSNDPRQRNTLILCVYNEQAPDHLPRFHGVK